MIDFQPGIVLQSVCDIDNEIMSTFIVYHATFKVVLWAHLRFPNKIYKCDESWYDFLNDYHGTTYHLLMKPE